jgi:hypothetical protein
MSAVLSNPSLAMASNVYRRQHGVWPEAVRFHPDHFVPWSRELTVEALALLACVFDVTVTTAEPSPRLTVSGLHGAVTYDHGVTEADWDHEPFDAWLYEQADTYGIPLSRPLFE